MISSHEELASTVVAAAEQNDFHRISTNQSREKSGLFLPRGVGELREMLDGLAELEFSPGQAFPLQKLCEAGAEYGVRTLEKTVSSKRLSLLRPKAKRHIKDNLRRILARATRPCFALELNAFRYAYQAIYPRQVSSTPRLMEKKFLGERPYDRLTSLFKKFPVLAELWSQLIHQWCGSVSELFERAEADKQSVSRVFFGGQPVGKIVDLRAGMSDPHNKGRTVMRIQFECGSIVYKPRCGHGEQEWFSLVRYLNATSFRPKLTAARVLWRDGYCWMQEFRFAPCKDQAGARRFYNRIGAMIAAAYLLKTVDCHRDNVIACGEHPVLVDAETLWHIADDNKTEHVLDPLYATGFLPSSGRRSSYQYRSSALGRTVPGKHTPHIGDRPVNAERYEEDIVNGFRRVWRCLLGTPKRRMAFSRRLQRLRSRERRRIYRSTGAYDDIMRASIQPSAMRSMANRNVLITRLCSRSAVPQAVVRKEIDALKRLDIPYFTRKTGAVRSLPSANTPPTEIGDALRKSLHL